MVDERLPFAEVTLAATHNVAFIWLILAMTTLFSVLGRSQVQVAFWTGAVIIFQSAIYLIQEVRVASLFRLSDFEIYGPVMAGNLGLEDLFLSRTVWLLLATAILYGIADRLFRRTAL